MGNSRNDTELLLLEVERRNKEKKYETDFVAYAEDNLKVISKNLEDGYVSFQLNPAQQLIHDKIEEQRKSTGMVRAIILKARQQGISTYCAGRAFWRTSREENVKTAVIAHQSKTAVALFDMSRNFHAQLPDEMKPTLASDSKQEMKFDGTNSSFFVITANSPESGRGLTPVIAQASECAFWQHDEKILAGLMQGVARSKGTEILLESTANGASGKFYELWQGATKGENSFLPIFIPWFLTPEYSTPPELMPGLFELTEEETMIAEEFDLTDNQLHWRRISISELGAEKFRQEYPATAEQAFVMGGNQVFNAEKMLNHETIPPTSYRNFDPISGYFEIDPFGKLSTWAGRQQSQKYVIGADVSQGVGQDSSVATVADIDGNIVAIYRDDRISPVDFGSLLFFLARDWNNAFLIVESNNHGGTTLQKLVDLNYSNLYYRQRMDDFTKQETEVPGFYTSGSTKPKIIGSLRDAFDKDTITIPSEVLLGEMKTYIAEGNKTEAARGYYDDTVMATALTCWALDNQKEKIARSQAWNQSMKNYNSDYVDTVNWI